MCLLPGARSGRPHFHSSAIGGLSMNTRFTAAERSRCAHATNRSRFLKRAGRRANKRLRLPRLELLETRYVLSGLWLAEFDGITPANTLDDQTEAGRNLLHARGLDNQDIHVVRAADFSGGFVLRTSGDVTEQTLNEELKGVVPGFVSVQEDDDEEDDSNDQSSEESDDMDSGPQ